MKRILLIVAHRPGRSPGQRFRFEQYTEYLEEHGYRFDFSYLLSEADDKIFYSKGHYFAKFIILLKSIRIRLKDLHGIRNYHGVLIYREAVMFGSSWFERRMKKAGARMILDFDDAIWLMDVSEGNRNLRWMKRPSKTAEIASVCDMVFAGNEYLAAYAGRFNSNVKVVPTTIQTDVFRRTEAEPPNGQICIGWTGSSTTLKHFGLAKGFLKRILSKYPGRIRIRMISDVPFADDELPVEFCRWSRETEVRDLCGIHIGIMPLPDDDWARGKCGFKGLQYMALGIPAVMAPVGVNISIITDGENGFLADHEDEWVDKISRLVESYALRRLLGDAGRIAVEQRFSFHAQKDRYLQFFEELTSAHS